MAKANRKRPSLGDLIRRLSWTRTLREKECSHLHLIQDFSPDTDVCQECVELGDTWPELRMCLICGYIGCCDAAENQHALRHHKATGHPLIRSIEGKENWIWCYVDEALLTPPR